MGILKRLFGGFKDSEPSDEISKTMESEPIVTSEPNYIVGCDVATGESESVISKVENGKVVEVIRSKQTIQQSLENIPNGDKVVRTPLGRFAKKE